MSLEYEFIPLEKDTVDKKVLEEFDCGNWAFNEFLRDDAINTSLNLIGKTYILIDTDEKGKDKTITKIFAFATIRTNALYYYDEDHILQKNSAVEIMYFAIRKSMQGITAVLMNNGNKLYSTIFFELLLQKLYELANYSISFEYVFLRANERGRKLYQRKLFLPMKNFLIPFEEDDKENLCTPMYLKLSDEDSIYNIYGIDD